MTAGNEMKWPVKRLRDLCVPDAPIMYGILQPGPHVPGGVPYVRPTEIGEDDGIRSLDLKRTSTAIAAKYRRSTLRGGDLLITIVGTLGRIAVVPKELQGANITQSSARIRLDAGVADRRYVWHVLRSDVARRQYDASRLGTGVPRLNIHHVRDLLIPLPALSEQRRIAEVLDKADALRSKRRAALAQLDILTQSIFLDMFGDPRRNPHNWRELRLGDLIVAGPQNGLYKPESSYGAGTPILRIDGFYDGEVSRSRPLRRVRVSEGELSRYGLQNDDIVINRVNSREYLGKSALIRSLDEATVFESNMMRLAVDCGVITPEYLISALQTRFVRSQILQRAKDAVNQSSINQDDVRAITVAVPPLALQRSFARAKHSAIMCREVNRRSMTQLDALFASLQHRAFRGEL